VTAEVASPPVVPYHGPRSEFSSVSGKTFTSTRHVFRAVGSHPWHAGALV